MRAATRLAGVWAVVAMAVPAVAEVQGQSQTTNAAVVTLPVVEESQWEWTTNADNTASITGYTGTGDAVAVPDKINGFPVTDIGDTAFAGCSNLLSIAIPANTTNIGVKALRDCRKLTSITVHAGNAAYASKEGVLFNKEQTTLIHYPRGRSGPYSIPDGVMAIGTEAFEGCNDLTRVTFGHGVATIGKGAFMGCCGKLTDVSIGPAVTNIGSLAFHCCFSLTNVVIPDCVTTIGRQAFGYCHSLTNISIGSSVSSIEAVGFVHCTNLTFVVIPASVTNIGKRAFLDCIRLKGIFFLGDCPNPESSVFGFDNDATVYYLPGSKGWGPTFCGRPTAVWKPQDHSDAVSGVRPK